MKFKLITYLAVPILYLSLPSQATNTYNFYFDANKETTSSAEEGKDKEALQKEDQEKSQEENKSTVETLAASIDESIEKAPHIDKKPSFIKLVDERYLNMGLGYESYFINPGASFIIQTKFLPYVGFELSIPHKVFKNLSEIYRFNAYLESSISSFLTAQINLGALHLAMPFGGYPKPFAGVGLNLKLTNWLHMYASANLKFLDDEFSEYTFGKYTPSLGFYSAGISLNLF